MKNNEDNGMPFVKGQPRPPGAGRKPGSQSTSQKLRELVFKALKTGRRGDRVPEDAGCARTSRVPVAAWGNCFRHRSPARMGDPVRITQIELVPLVADAAALSE